MPYFPATCPCNISPYRHLNNKVQSDHIVITISKDSYSISMSMKDRKASLLHRRETSNGRDGANVRIGKLGFEGYCSCKIKPCKFSSIFLQRYICFSVTALHQDGRVVKALDLRSNGRIVRVGSNPTPGNVLFAIIFQPKYESLIQTLQILSRNFWI